jgi:DNA-binding NarL/FixJ family response regulator
VTTVARKKRMKTTKFMSRYLRHLSRGKGAFPLEKPILRVLIVEGHEPMRKFIAIKLRGKLQLRIVAEVAGGVDAVQKAEELRPDLIVMDVGLPRLDGIEATRHIQKVHPKSKILFVTENCSPDVAEEALRSGGLGYVLKSNAEEHLLPAVDAVLRSKWFISFGLVGTLPRSRRPHRIGRVLRAEWNAKI